MAREASRSGVGAAALALALSACSSSAEPVTEREAEPVAERVEAPRPAAGEPAAVPGPGALPPAEEVVARVTWVADPPFVARRPQNRMRAAEYGVEGHPEAVLAVFHFPRQEGGGGSVPRNIARWLGQLRQEDGSPTQDHATIERRTLNGLPATEVDATGVFVGRRGTGGAAPRPGWRIRGAIVEGPEGPVFLKLTGPEEAVAAADEAWGALLRSIHAL